MSVANNQFISEEINRIDKADDLKISPLRSDASTYGTPTWIWAVVVNGDLYVRAYSGISSTWYQSAIKEEAGRIYAAGMIKDVLFEAVNGSINIQIDEAYKNKYNNSPYLKAMISDRARSATVRITLKKLK